MDCREFDIRFEGWCGGTLPGEERAACEEHLEACASCRELAQLARLPVPAMSPVPPMDGSSPASLLTAVLERTSGNLCARVEPSLPELVDGELVGQEKALLAEHVDHCGQCSRLVAEIERLAVELPRLAEVVPEPSLVSSVLRVTLPFSVRARRWWQRTEARWVQRPRFAAELSYIATLVLVVLVATPFSPLQAMPQKALEIVRTERVEAPERLDAWRAAAARELDHGLQVVQGELSERTQGLAATTKQTAGTILEEVASWFVDAGDEEVEPVDENQKAQETS